MAIKYPELFEPFYIGKCKIKNRICMAPMHLGGRGDTDGNYTEEILAYFEERAKGGIGLIYTGSMCPDTNIELSPLTLSPFANPLKYTPIMSKLAEKVHAYGTKLFVELGGGTGRVTFPSVLAPEMNGIPVAPSAVSNRWDTSITCRPLTRDEILRLIDTTIAAAPIAQAAGADGVCISGPYGGYLTDQFAQKAFNLRDDEFGYDGKHGEIKVVLDIIKGIKKECGPDFPVVVRFTPKNYIKAPLESPLPGEEFEEFGRDIDESIVLAKLIEDAGADSLLIGNGSYDSFYWLYPPVYQKEALWIEDAKRIKDAVNIPVVCPGRLNTPEIANTAVKEGFIDAVAIGRASLADPQWANKAHDGKDEDIRPCIGCQTGCIGRVFVNGLVTCAVNPQLFYEKTEPLIPALTKKNIAVIGGGVGGMEAALIAAKRGHNVDLYEKSDKLGGLFNLAAVPDFKHGDRKLLAWFPKALEDAGVKVHLNSELSISDIEKLDADEFVIATGSTPKVIPIEGISEKNVVTASDILAGTKSAGEKIVVLGGGLVGCETALWLAKQGKEVTIMDILPALMSAGVPVPLPNMLMMLDMLKAEHVNIITGAAASGYKDGKLTYTAEKGNGSVDADTIIQAIGYTPNDSLYNEMAEKVSKTVWNVGDSKMVANVMNSVKDGFFVGKNI